MAILPESPFVQARVFILVLIVILIVILSDYDEEEGRSILGRLMPMYHLSREP